MVVIVVISNCKEAAHFLQLFFMIEFISPDITSVFA